MCRIRNFNRVDLVEVNLRQVTKLRSDVVVKVLKRVGFASETNPAALFVAMDLDPVTSH
jgi:hypothetical protein